MNSTDSDVFYVEESSNEQSLPRLKTPMVLNCSEVSGIDSREMIFTSPIASLEQQIVTNHSDSNEPTMSNGVGRQLPIIPPNLTDLNLPTNPFNILETMAVANHTEDGNDDNYSPQSTEPSDPSPISTPPMNVSTFNSWERLQTTTGDNTFYSEDEPRRIYWTSPLDKTFYSEGQPRRIFLSSSPSPPSRPRKVKRKLEMGMSFPKRGGVSQHVCEACGQMIPSKAIPGPSTKN